MRIFSLVDRISGQKSCWRPQSPSHVHASGHDNGQPSSQHAPSREQSRSRKNQLVPWPESPTCFQKIGTKTRWRLCEDHTSPPAPLERSFLPWRAAPPPIWSAKNLTNTLANLAQPTRLTITHTPLQTILEPTAHPTSGDLARKITLWPCGLHGVFSPQQTRKTLSRPAATHSITLPPIRS